MFHSNLVKRFNDKIEDSSTDEITKHILRTLLALNGEVDRLHEENQELRQKVNRLEDR